MKCIYCGSQNIFNKEHVIPQFLGTFEPINPTLKTKDKLVCQNCNSKIFSSLETEFKEDSWEGITGQMLNLTRSNSVRIRGANVKIECLSGLGDKFFDEIFPFLKEENGKFVVDLKPQIKVRNYAGESGYQIFLFDALKEIKRNPKKYERVKERIKTTGKNNFAIFTGGDSKEDDTQMNEAIALLKDYGITYNEKERKFIPVNPTGNKQFEVNMTCTITPNICRLIAKVAFNYFSFCALQDQNRVILYGSFFDKIKRFILGDTKIERNEIITEASNDPITYHEKESEKRFLGHIIVFFQEDGRIFSKLTFLGGKVYKVLLGIATNDFQNNNFGCGHLFFPFDKSIHNLTQLPKENPTNEEIKQSFGLFRRIDLKSKQ